MPLWEHQTDALTILTRYLRRSGPSKGAALVTMPTGTGKSAVIASLIAGPQVGGKKKNALVVTPWRGLARQLAEDIDKRVWERLEIDRPDELPTVRLVASAKNFIEHVSGEVEREPVVHVATLSMALTIFETVEFDEAVMATLFADFATVIVDECHYEPAPSWSRAVRAAGLPICLFTATPFRNDNRMFAIDSAAQYRYTHADAVADHVLREPQFEYMDETTSAHQYVDALLDKLEHVVERRPGDRVIVRCSNRADVQALATALVAKNRKVIAVHEAFTGNEESPHLRKVMPAPSDRPDVEFLVHQHKLTEGFDDPAVRVLAIYGGFGNDRARVQQVGRILRNPTRVAGQRAFVFSGDETMQEAWERYLRFDQTKGPKSVATDPVGVAKLLGAQPDIFYWDRLFREKADLKADGAWNAIKYRLSTCIRRPTGKFELDDFAARVAHELTSGNGQVLAQFQPSDDTCVILHMTVRNSPILREAAFVEMSLGYTVLHWNGEYLFVSASDGLTECVRTDTTSVGATGLVGLLPGTSTITSMSLTNNDLSDWAVRSRSIRARDVGAVAGEVGDSTFGYSTASGSLTIDDKFVTRYTGVKNGRVSDYRESKGLYSELRGWFDELTAALKRGDKPASAIGRYGFPVTLTEPPVAAHVLLDIAPEAFEPSDDRHGPLVIDWSGGAVENGRFKVEINDKQVEVEIAWDASLKRFNVSSDQSVPYRPVNDNKQDFWQFITREQQIRVATDSGMVYSNKNFWKLNRRNSSSDDGLLSIIETHQPLSKVVAEKGHTTGQHPWPDETVFGQLDNHLLPNALGNDATILCTDLGSEIADFIGFDSEKVIFAHAKSKSVDNSSEISAAALHEVVSQAMKSLRFLTLGNEDRPVTGYWAKEWKIERAKKPERTYGPATRLRRGMPQDTGEEHWDMVNKVVQSHAASREVWLVLGACLSKSALKEELAKDRPNAVAVQAHALLSAAWSSAQQCGIRLRVYCSEERAPRPNLCKT
ncbi:DEAD/DEAH box helicase family protein [Arthrobacter sp. R1-13]